MKTISNLTEGSLIQVKGILGKISICTLAAFAAKNGTTVEYHEELDRKHSRETQYAWTMQHAGCITADYPGKAEAHAKEMAARNAAPLVETGDILEVDGVFYEAKVLGNYSNPVKLALVIALA